jgi:hypothetical protein
MTDEFGATKGGPEIVDSRRKVTGEAENKTSEMLAGALGLCATVFLPERQGGGLHQSQGGPNREGLA